MTQPPPPPPSRRKLVKEISIFLMGIGILLAGVGYLVLTQISPNAPSIGRIDRGVALGVPLLSLGGLQLLCGLLLLITRQVTFAVVGTLASAAIAVMALVIGGVSLLTLLFVASPLLLGQRISMLVKSKDEEKDSSSPP